MTILNGGWAAALTGSEMKRFTCSNMTCSSSGPANIRRQLDRARSQHTESACHVTPEEIAPQTRLL